MLSEEDYLSTAGSEVIYDRSPDSGSSTLKRYKKKKREKIRLKLKFFEFFLISTYILNCFVTSVWKVKTNRYHYYFGVHETIGDIASSAKVELCECDEKKPWYCFQDCI